MSIMYKNSKFKENMLGKLVLSQGQYDIFMSTKRPDFTLSIINVMFFLLAEFTAFPYTLA